mmetsp:Transcript_3508/g.10890  ORF Transcript_3508/g.10890 Transcript_3508/m.10890 type:complete len:359 (-) Transcript_3508:995-2071(-)
MAEEVKHGHDHAFLVPPLHELFAPMSLDLLVNVVLGVIRKRRQDGMERRHDVGAHGRPGLAVVLHEVLDDDPDELLPRVLGERLVRQVGLDGALLSIVLEREAGHDAVQVKRLDLLLGWAEERDVKRLKLARRSRGDEHRHDKLELFTDLRVEARVETAVPIRQDRRELLTGVNRSAVHDPDDRQLVPVLGGVLLVEPFDDFAAVLLDDLAVVKQGLGRDPLGLRRPHLDFHGFRWSQLGLPVAAETVHIDALEDDLALHKIAGRVGCVDHSGRRLLHPLRHGVHRVVLRRELLQRLLVSNAHLLQELEAGFFRQCPAVRALGKEVDVGLVGVHDELGWVSVRPAAVHGDALQGTLCN